MAMLKQKCRAFLWCDGMALAILAVQLCRATTDAFLCAIEVNQQRQLGAQVVFPSDDLLPILAQAVARKLAIDVLSEDIAGVVFVERHPVAELVVQKISIQAFWQQVSDPGKNAALQRLIRDPMTGFVHPHSRRGLDSRCRIDEPHGLAGTDDLLALLRRQDVVDDECQLVMERDVRAGGRDRALARHPRHGLGSERVDRSALHRATHGQGAPHPLHCVVLQWRLRLRHSHAC
mmetsp:Transcript_14600/g.34466  ORF Transcript_14600/g.34466 Transcript_14600/m.34466 type:complete len:233 (-) Transcript_14600:93-791(-)